MSPDPFGEFYDKWHPDMIEAKKCKYCIYYDFCLYNDKGSMFKAYCCKWYQESKAQDINLMKGGNNMGYSKKAKAADANAEEKNMIKISEIEVTRASEIKEGTVAFDMTVRGIAIQGCFMRQYTNKEGAEGDLISFPSYKGNNGKYYNYVWFPISKELKEQLKEKIISLLG